VEEFQTEIVNKKELGQFFSGQAVASLLLNLSKLGGAKRVIDPMCGTGDMLLAFVNAGWLDSNLTGIEIDKPVHACAVNRLLGHANVQLTNSNAFSIDTLMDLSSAGAYDLVITNPPYVRRQMADSSEYNLPGTLNLNEIRENLTNFVQVITTINDRERQLFSLLIKHFSGLSDLAVPAWILCALLVKKGGKIAMVLPEAWLSRDYALIVKYLLLRFFELEYIIEDANSTWFKTAQVKTMLLVAKRVESKESLSDWQKEAFSYVSLYSDSTAKNGLVGNIFPESTQPEKEFIKAIDTGASKAGLFKTRKILLKDFSEDFTDHALSQKWFKLVEPKILAGKTSKPAMKGESDLRHWYDGAKVEFCKLQDLGVIAAQGLRTGANSFFYLDFKIISPDEITVFPDSSFKCQPFQINKEYFKEVVRRQAELDAGFSLFQFQPTGVVLSLQSYALPEDISYVGKCNNAFNHIYSPVPDSLGEYIRTAATTRNGNNPTDRLIPDLSAVSPNVRRWNERKPIDIPKFWYMLPAFSRRHFPDLFMPRVNTGGVKTRLNNERRYLIDANFSSLWIQTPDSPYDNYALLALLNSTYAIVAMEEYGTVMGGGALKLEATQLKRIPFPLLEVETINSLAVLGRQLSVLVGKADSLIREIDLKILSGMGFEFNMTDKLNQLESIKHHLLKKRAPK
jgi:phospholipid N-methyltransferase